jgi:hypothetical protein
MTAKSQFRQFPASLQSSALSSSPEAMVVIRKNSLRDEFSTFLLALSGLNLTERKAGFNGSAFVWKSQFFEYLRRVKAELISASASTIA